MFISTKTLLYILFELTIFIILAIQIYQLSTQFLIPFLRKQIVQLKKFWTDLQSQIKLLMSTKKRLKKKIAEQEETLDSLEEKVKQWHDKLQIKQATLQREQRNHLELLAAQKKEEYERLCRTKHSKELFPDALANAKKQLQQTYQGNEGKKLLSSVLQDLIKMP